MGSKGVTGKIPILIIILVTVFTLVVAGAVPSATNTASAAENTSYTATVKYYDNVMITYDLNYPNGGIWTGSADIPIGGASYNQSNLFSQIYCVDPFVAFHPKANTTWEGPSITNSIGEKWGATTTDVKEGYVAAAPWSMSGAMRKNLDSVRWLTLNGYHGDFLKNDQESISSVARLNAMYPGIGTIDKTIALMATKVVIWKVLSDDGDDDPTNDALNILKTSLDSNPAKKQTFDNLVASMLADSKNQPRTTVRTGELKDITTLELSISDNTNTVSPDSDSTYTYYGPLSVSASLGPGGDPVPLSPLSVFLTASGEDTGDTTFVTETGGVYTTLPSSMIYGTNQTAQYVTEGQDFYLRIPNTREGLLPGGTSPYDQLVIKAMSKAAGIPVQGGTPVVLVSGDSGIQDWNEVQAFVGAAKDNMQIDLYAETSLQTEDTTVGELYVQKCVENGTPLDDEQVFNFKVFYAYLSTPPVDPPNPADLKILDLSEHPVYGASVNTGNNTFSLKNGGLAQIVNLPVDESNNNYYYWVMEEGKSKYIPQYEIPIAESTKGRSDSESYASVAGAYSDSTSAFQISTSGDTEGLAFVTFYNTKSAMSHLEISKYAMEFNSKTGDPDMEYLLETPFSFRLEYSGDGKNWSPVDLSACTFVSDGGPHKSHGGSLMHGGTDGEFTLRTYETAFIEVNPEGFYRTVELDPGDGWWTSYGIMGAENGRYIWALPGDNPGFFSVAGDRKTQEFPVNEEGTYYMVFTNLTSDFHDLKISKTVDGDKAAKKDFSQLFPFILYHKIDSKTLEPIPLSVDGGWLNIKGVAGNYMTFLVEIRNKNGDLLKKEDIAKRIKNKEIDTKLIGLNGGVQPIPVEVELKHGETATIKQMLEGNYEAKEVLDGFDGRYDPSYSYTVGSNPKSGDGGTISFALNEDGEMDFVNTVSTLNKKNKSNGTDGEGGSTKGDFSDTGDYIDFMILLTSMLLSVLCMNVSYLLRRN